MPDPAPIADTTPATAPAATATQPSTPAPAAQPASQPAAQPAAPTTPAPASTLLTPAPTETPAQPAAPTEIKVNFPKGLEPDKAIIDKFTKLAQDAKLDSAGAQKIVDFWAEVETAASEAHMSTIVTWAEEAKNDQEIGGAKFDATLASARKVLDRLGTPDLKNLLVTTGLGNHKAVIGFLAKIGNVISEDRLPGNGGAPQPASTMDEQVKAFFNKSPDMFQRKE